MDAAIVAIGIGLVVSLIFTEVFGLSAGGMIVPGYLALHMNRPLDIVATLLVAAATFGIVRGVSQFAIVYGRRRIVLMMLVGFVLAEAARMGLRMLPGGEPAEAAGGLMLHQAIGVVGCIVPGLIALWYDRQGMVTTASTALVNASVVWLCLAVIGLEVLG